MINIVDIPNSGRFADLTSCEWSILHGVTDKQWDVAKKFPPSEMPEIINQYFGASNKTKFWRDLARAKRCGTSSAKRYCLCHIKCDKRYTRAKGADYMKARGLV